MQGEENRSAPPAVLRGAGEAFGYSHLMGHLPGVADRLGCWVVLAVRGRGGDRPCCFHTHRGLLIFAEVLNGDSPGCFGRLLSFRRVQGGCDPYMHRICRQLLSWRRRAKEVETRAALANAGYPCGYPVAVELSPGALV